MEKYPNKKHVRSIVDRHLHNHLESMMNDPIAICTDNICMSISRECNCLVDREGYELIYSALQTGVVRVKAERRHRMTHYRSEECDIINSIVIKTLKSFLGDDINE